MTIVSLDERGTGIGVDRFGFHVVVDGVAMFGPLPSRETAREIAVLWSASAQQAAASAFDDQLAVRR